MKELHEHYRLRSVGNIMDISKISSGKSVPEEVNVIIEVPMGSSPIKYELDKESGLLKIDRPQKFSNLCPALYGFVPQTYCGKEIANFCMEKSGLTGIKGDGDPLDICVLSERPIQNHNILLQCIPIGGLRMVDKHEADDKIIAVLKDDLMYGHMHDISELPEALLQRLLHYFKTYKLDPQSQENKVVITDVYGANECKQVLQFASSAIVMILLNIIIIIGKFLNTD
jgi:inorganic pyrophosphatase